MLWNAVYVIMILVRYLVLIILKSYFCGNKCIALTQPDTNQYQYKYMLYNTCE